MNKKFEFKIKPFHSILSALQITRSSWNCSAVLVTSSGGLIMTPCSYMTAKYSGTEKCISFFILGLHRELEERAGQY